jgi:hypothetical protein
MVERFTARSGAPSLRIDGIALHSPYDPAREADRFVEVSLKGESPSTIVLLGEGLGYATRALGERIPSARLVRVFYSEEIFGFSDADRPPSWHPGSPQSIADFLRANIGELDMEGLRVIEWQPSASLFPSLSRTANEALRQVLQELNGSLVTTLAAGKLWIRNSIANFLCLDRSLAGAPCDPARTVVVAASGASLERSLPLVARARGSVELWALPSSALYLRESGVRPDLIVMTDPGHWSMVHLHFAAPPCPIAMPLSAARGIWRLGRTAGAPLLLSQPSFFEEQLLGAAGVAAPRIAPHGTVAATALDLALSCTRGPVVAAGLDMCAEDITTHCRPNAFDELLWLREGRVRPHLSQSFHRVAAQEVARERSGATTVRILRSQRTYAGWFSEQSPLDRGRLFRLHPSPVALQRFAPLDGDEFLALAAAHAGAKPGHGLRNDQGYPDRARREAIVARLLGVWAEVVAQGARGLHGKGLAAFADSPALFPLAYHVDARGLLDARKKARAGDAAGALQAAESILARCAEFLRELVEKTSTLQASTTLRASSTLQASSHA